MWQSWIERRFNAMLEKAKAKLGPGETVLAATWGGTGRKGFPPGVLIATESRIVRYYRFFWKEDVASCPYHAINLMRDNKALGRRRLEFHFIHGAILFQPCEIGPFKARSEAVIAEINRHMPQEPRSEVAPAAPADSPADRLMKLHALLTSGAITQAEYDAKKQELLTRI